jgi:hypothetical protein
VGAPGVTVTVRDALTVAGVPEVGVLAVIVAVPILAAVTTPPATVATLGSLLDHVRTFPVSAVPPLLRILAVIVVV